MKTKFLIIRFSSIGDIVLTTPVARIIKEQVKDAEVHYVTKKQFASLVSSNPHVDKVHVFEDNLGLLVKALRAEQYNYIIDLHKNLRTFILKLRLLKRSFSFNKLNIEKWIYVQFKINNLPKVHIVDRYLDTLKKFKVTNDNKGLDFFIDSQNEININALPDDFKNGYVAFVIGAKHTTKQMTVSRIVQLIRLLKYPVILLGGAEDKEKASQIVTQIGGTDVLNACGEYNLQQSASFVKQAKVVITHDTGLMHIAAAFKQNVISIWGNTVPDFGMYPYLPGKDHFMFQVNNLNCRPCSKLGFNECPKGHFYCMEKLNLKSIAEKCKQLTAEMAN